MTFDLCLT